MTTTRGSVAAANEAHALNFELDNDNDSCALTVLVKDFRFHITADAEDFSKHAAGVGRKFQSLVGAVRAEQEEAEYRGNGEGDENEDDKVQITSTRRDTRRATKKNNSSTSSDADSGVDISSPSPEGTRAKDSASSPLSCSMPADENAEDPEKELRNWMLKPLAQVFDGLEPVSESEGGSQERQTLQEWYSGPTYFYRLTIGEDGKLSEQQLDCSTDLDRKIGKLAPRISVPKAIQNLDIPWFDASEIEVVSAGDHRGLHGPTEVRIRTSGSNRTAEDEKQDGDDDTVYFFKRVDPAQSAPTCRELRMLREIESKGLDQKMNVPRVKGLVRWYGKNSCQIMGFLQTNIEDPTPLTHMLDSDVVEEKRQEWARAAEKAVKVLHEANMVWGDAKADNFMVDRHGKLWIIDFGGSYTEGWIDPDLEETVEGDDMGVDKIVNALKDPENMTYDPDAGIVNAYDEQELGEQGDASQQGAKRGRDACASETADEGRGSQEKRIKM